MPGSTTVAAEPTAGDGAQSAPSFRFLGRGWACRLVARKVATTTVLDPDHATRVAPTHGSPPGVRAGGSGEANPHALQILMTEHWSLLASRSMGYTEAMSRASIFVAALTGSVVALALVAQATDVGREFVAFALVLLPVVYFLGVVTFARLLQNGWEDGIWVQGMNRIRHAYLELAPELEPYFVTSRYDDDTGVLISAIARPRVTVPLQGFVAIPGVVAVLDSVVAGTVAGIAGVGLKVATGASLAFGAAAFLISLVAFVLVGIKAIETYRRNLVVRFPTPSAKAE
jgi:hypothetical protein